MISPVIERHAAEMPRQCSRAMVPSCPDDAMRKHGPMREEK